MHWTTEIQARCIMKIETQVKLYFPRIRDRHRQAHPNIFYWKKSETVQNDFIHHY